MGKVIWTKVAFEDLKLIYDFIAVDSERYAGKVIEKIKKRTLILKDHQRIGRVVPEFKDVLLRELFEYSYRIVYRIKNESEVEILRIHHQAQTLPPV